MAQLSYRESIAAALAYEMTRDERVVLFGEDTAAAGGVFKTTEGLLAKFGPRRVKDMPISELAILGAAMGMAMTGLRPVAEIMFSDFLACCWDYVANEIPKARYMSNGQITLPLVIRTLNGAGARFGAQHSQSVENWAMAVPGIKVVAPSNAADAKGLLLAAIRDPDPVIFFEHKYLLSSKCNVPDGEHLVPLGQAAVLREGSDVTIIALAAMVPKALQAADMLDAEHGIEATVIDVRTLVPLDLQTLLRQAKRTGRVFTVEENPRLCGWGAEIASIIQEQAFSALKQPIVRITTPHVPIPATDQLEDAVVPSVARIVAEIRRALEAHSRKPRK
jgi:pyruvate/2-oxoglutarate/acetoin dehydrogenase E1 component